MIHVAGILLPQNYQLPDIIGDGSEYFTAAKRHTIISKSEHVWKNANFTITMTDGLFERFILSVH